MRAGAANRMIFGDLIVVFFRDALSILLMVYRGFFPVRSRFPSGSYKWVIRRPWTDPGGNRVITQPNSRHNRLIGAIHSAVRIVVGVLFVCHGAASLFGVLGGAAGTHGGTVPFGVWPGWWAALIEFAGGLLVLVGLWTRVAALLCSGAMAFAYFTVHQPHALLPIQNGGEPAVLFCWIFLLIAVLGSGPVAIDTLLRQRGQKSETPAVADLEMSVAD
jgi:putative oxidoreductase